MKKTYISMLLALTMVFGAIAGPAQVLAQEATAQHTKTVTLLHTNDIHGHATADEKGGNIGYAKVKTYADSIPNSVLIDAGDVLHGTTLASISRGESIVALMNAMGYKAMVPGNHDYNYGYDRLIELAGAAEFPVLAANVIRSTGQRDLKDQTMIEVDGVKIGMFGLSTEESKTKSNPANTEGILFLNPVEVAKAQVKSLKEKGADVIVADVHLGVDDSTEIKSTDIAKAVDGIDVIIDGHSHTEMPDGRMVNGTLIAQTGGHLKQLGEVNITLRDGKVIAKSATLHDQEFFKNVKEDEKILAMIAGIEEANKPYLETVIGKTDVVLDGEREHVRTGETNLGNLLTDAMLKVTGADVAITNGGGIRASIDIGEITRGEVLTSFPFTNYPVKLEVKGKDILAALEYGLDAAPEAAGKFPHVAGMTVKYDPKQAVGNRIIEVKVKSEALDPDKTYTLATNDFMAVGGDGYKMFAGKKKLGEYNLLSEVLADYIAEAKVVSPKTEGRMTVGEKSGEKPGEKTPEEVFVDIKGHWAEDIIMSVYNDGYFTGMTRATFEPDTKISRAMLVTTLARLEGQDKKQDAKNPFPDVEKGKWYENAVVWAVENKLVKGYEDKSFKPEQNVSREEMAAILGRYVDMKKFPVTQQMPAPFADDAQIAKWAKEYLIPLQNMGVMNGREQNRFYPKDSATRAELAKVIQKLAQIKEANAANDTVNKADKPQAVEKPVEKSAKKAA